MQALEDRVDFSENGIRQINSSLDQLATDLRNFRAQLRNLEGREQDTELELSRSRDDLADARFARDRGQQAVDRDQFARDTVLRTERNAYAYYQEVLANYNEALAAAKRKGQRDAASDFGREASERAAQPSRLTGSTDGNSDGRTAGMVAAKKVAAAEGYNYGLRTGREDSNLAQAYSEGVETGTGVANSKAKAEDFPQGYNLSLNEVLSVIPQNEATYDISDGLHDIPGESGPILVPQPQPIGNEPAPGFETTRFNRDYNILAFSF